MRRVLLTKLGTIFLILLPNPRTEVFIFDQKAKSIACSNRLLCVLELVSTKVNSHNPPYSDEDARTVHY